MKHLMNRIVLIVFIILSIMSISTAKEYNNTSSIDLSGIDRSIFDTMLANDEEFMDTINNIVSQDEVNEADRYIDLDFINPYDIGFILAEGPNNSSPIILEVMSDPNFTNISEVVEIEPATF